MVILPAIDLLGGKCVRLIQGRYDRVIDYESDPVEIAARFRAVGAEWLHVIDLDGARSGEIRNLPMLTAIIRHTGARVQFGGGVRDAAAIHAALTAGAERVIVGTRALQDWTWFEHVVHTPDFAGRIALGLDARLGKLAVHGWTQQTERSALTVARAVAAWPLAAIVYTDIGRDGVLLGPNVDAIGAVAGAAPLPVIASGGVSELADVRRLADMNLAGTVIGRALYEGAIQLAAALEAAARPSQ